VPTILYRYDWRTTRRFTEVRRLLSAGTALLVSSCLIASHRIASHRIASHRIASHRFSSLLIASVPSQVQRLPTVGAHDVELLVDANDATLLALIANGASWNASAAGDGEACDNDVHVYRFEDGRRRFVTHQHLAVEGCATFVRAWRAHPRHRPAGMADGAGAQVGADGAARTFVAVAVERTRAGSYDTSVRVFEWQHDADPHA
jgi:hypothetical protein